ncbi:hypothetical protein H9P43_007041 [Blastocladiella emersonii ATCC 22665]|nr:hypothetical protein H9P43_007041 [Blastocladiella emersonii ATCC 22665]
MAGNVAPPIAHLPPSLVSLNLSNCNQSFGLFQLLQVPLPESLARLDLSNNVIRGPDLATLGRALPPRLIELQLANVKLFRRSLGMTLDSVLSQQLGALASHFPPTLATLDLRGSRIGNKGIAALAQHLPASLTTLILSNNGISDYSQLVRHMPPQLERLEMTEERSSFQDFDLDADRTKFLETALKNQRDEVSAKLVDAFPPTLKHLAFNRLRTRYHRSFFYFIRYLPPALKTLDLRDCSLC